jgi:hypothetical protein
MMILQYHQNCKTNKGHKPERTIKVKSIQQAIRIIADSEIDGGYLDWHKPDNEHHYIIYPTYAEDYKNYKKDLTTRIIKRRST